ncbi:MAG: hypothetical protein ACR2QQ_00955 [Gammaproteobacteria bacterium]
MFKQIRVMILVYILAFVAIGNFLSSARTTDWDETLWVDVYPINADSSQRTQAYIDGLESDDFNQIEMYFSREASRYGVTIDQPFRVELGPQIDNDVPVLPAEPSIFDTLIWSLKMRWYAATVDHGEGRPKPDIKLFALFYDESDAAILDRSTALERGLIAIANVFAGRASTGPNQIVMAHELLHTLGATDKYDLATNLPIYPYGFAAPEQHPRYPQADAELMAGRIPIDGRRAEIPTGLDETLIGVLTAAEIGWREDVL